jgi:hypothetical protein
MKQYIISIFIFKNRNNYYNPIWNGENIKSKLYFYPKIESNKTTGQVKDVES